jgi:hypothetical protein
MFAVNTNTAAKPKNVLSVDGLVFIAVNDAENTGLGVRGLDDDGNFQQKLTIVKTGLRFLVSFEETASEGCWYSRCGTSK